MKKATIALLLICVTAFAQQKGTFTDTRDGKTYKTVKIGKQTWMAENLNYNAKGSKCYGEGGKTIMKVDKNGNPTAIKTLSNKEVLDNCAKYGRLYDISTAMKACPSGWSLPSYGVRGIEGYDETLVKKLKSASGWSNNGNGTDEYGFSALPGGNYYDGSFYGVGEKGFYGIGEVGYWWNAYDSDEDGDGDGAYYYSIGNDDYDSWNPSKGYHLLLSVRCVRNITAAEAAEQKAKEAARLAALQSSFTDPREKKTYKTVKIGSQTWMAENLNYNASDSKCYDNKPANCEKYGRLYDWNTALKACPSGWHLPSIYEYETLDNTAGGKVAGKKLKARSGWNKDDKNTDEFGFSALPGGFGILGGSFGSFGNYGYWWSATEYNSYNAYYQGIGYDDGGVNRKDIDKPFLLSVRCLKD